MPRIQSKFENIPLAKRIYWPSVMTLLLMHAFAIYGFHFLLHGTSSLILLLTTLALFHFITGCLGISLGFHRLLSHRSFAAPLWLSRTLATCGTLAWQGGPLTWVALHRSHHRHVNTLGDPHAASRGYWFSHVLWACLKAPNGFRLRRLAQQAPDLSNDRYLLWLERNQIGLNVGIVALLLTAARILSGTWNEAIGFISVVVALRVCIVWHSTWLINSWAHLRASEPSDGKNCHFLALFTYGEGLHANHHQTPLSANFSKGPAEVDLGFLVLRAFGALGALRLSEKTSQTNRKMRSSA